MALTEQQLVALARRHQDQLLSVRDRAVTVIDRLWARLATNPSQDALGRWLDAAIPVVQSASEMAATASLAYVPTYVAGAGETPRGAELAVSQFLRPRGVDLADVLTRPFVTMRTALANGDTMERARQIAGARARQIAATDPLLAARAASSAAMRSDPSIVGYRRVPDAGACAFCRLAATQRYRDSDLMAMHSSCVVAGTTVQGPKSLHGTRRWYAGPGVVVGTTSGDLLTITPNHPVLTSSGWIPAGLLKEGDDVVRRPITDGVVRGVPGEHDVVSRIEDVVGALAMQRLVAVPLSAEDFHGDGPNGHVGVEAADRLLWSWFNSTLPQESGELLLARRTEVASILAGAGGAHALLGGGNPPPGRCVSCGGPLSAIGGVQSEHLGASDIGRWADGDLGFVQVPPHHGATDSESLRYRENGLSALIAGDHPFEVDSTTPRFDPTTTEFGDDRRVLHTDRGRHLAERLAGQVELDRVVLVRRIDLATHVYNLHTTEGWYSANGIIVSNCGCTVAPIIGDRDPGQIIDRDALRSLKADGVIDEISLRRYISSTNDVVASYEAKAREWRERARLADSQADETRYAKRADDWAAKARKRAADVEQARARLRAVQAGRLDRLTAVHEHGELGPVLYPAGVEFTAA